MDGKTVVRAKTERGRGIVAVIAIVVLAAVLCAVLSACGVFRTALRVGRDIAPEAITAFYSTEASSTDPPYYRQFRFWTENGKYFFAREVREGSHWPLTEEDITVFVEKELSEQERAELLQCLDGGTVTKRTEDISAGGSGPWLYLYWNGDRGKYQVFTFSDNEKAAAFGAFCTALAEE